jgi:glycosyltransferase involved in cell wall biosynthesis
MTPSEPLVSVNIPCYRQLDLLRRALDTIRDQSHTSLDVNLLDDGASDECRGYVESLGDTRIHYHRNPERLGAMRNMFSAITAGRGEFTMAFHEDDLLSTSYVAAALAIFRSQPTCAFVACQLREFEREPSPEALRAEYASPAYDSFATEADLVRGILRGVEPMFGSVVYRRAALDGVSPDHDTYATLVDRPFLLSLMARGWTAAVIQSPLVWYRHHGDGDARHLAMTSDHVLRLLRTYREILPSNWTASERAAFFKYSGYWLFELYRLTPPSGRPPVWKYLFRAWRQGLYSPRARGRFGIRQLQRALLNQTS